MNYRIKWNLAKWITPSAPLHVDIELSSVCNLRCCFCPQSDTPDSFNKSLMSVETFASIIDEIAGVVPAIKLNLRGESTLHPGFAEMCKYVKGKFKDIRLNTNGNYNAIMTKVIAETFDEVSFSVDAYSENTYRKIRVGGNFAELKRNIIRLAHYIPKKKQCKIVLSFVETEWNSHELKAFKSHWKALLPEVYFFVRKAAQRTKDGPYLCGNDKAIGRKNCLMPVRRLSITHDGMVYPCCVATWAGGLSIGDVSDGDSILNLWRSNKIKELRRFLKSGAMFTEPGHDQSCKNCYSRESYKWEKS